MHVLFVHQNCPAQFKDVAPALVKRGWQATFCTTNAKAAPGDGVRKVVYRPVNPAKPGAADPLTSYFTNETAHAYGVYEAMKRTPDVKPDLVVAHSGFGSSLFLPLLYDAPVINFFEYFFRPGGLGQHLGYRPDAAVHERGLMRLRLRNAGFLLDLDNCTRGWCPNRSQRDTLPAEYHPKVEVIPEGVDTDFWRPSRVRRTRTQRVLPDGTSSPRGPGS